MDLMTELGAMLVACGVNPLAEVEQSVLPGELRKAKGHRLMITLTVEDAVCIGSMLKAKKFDPKIPDVERARYRLICAICSSLRSGVSPALADLVGGARVV